MKSLRNIVIVYLFMLSFQLMAQSGEPVYVAKADMAAVFEKINSWFSNTPTYSLTITHASYENYTTAVPADKSVGYFKKEKEKYHSFLMGIHTVQNTEYKFVVDTAQKMILVANPDKLAWPSYTTEEYAALLKSYTTIKMSYQGADKLYRIDLPSASSIGAYEFLIDADGMLKKITWYYNQEIKKDEENEKSKVKPRVSISFSGYNKNEVIDPKSEFNGEQYFVKKNNKLVATNKYQNYILSDQRIYN